MSLREGEEDQNTFKFMAPHTTSAWAIRPSYLKAGPLEVCKNVFQSVCLHVRKKMLRNENHGEIIIKSDGWEKIYKLINRR